MLTANVNPDDPEITINRGGLRLVAAPYGASLRGLTGRDSTGHYQDIITGYHGAANKAGGQGDVLVPFPGRIAGGQYSFEGQDHHLERNDKDGPNAIHGFLRRKVWRSGVDGDEITFTTFIDPNEFAGYPFALDVTVSYRLIDDGLVTEYRITNTGKHAAPVATGFHPYFTVGSDTIDGNTVTIPFSHYLEFDSHLIPTGKVLPVTGTPLDFQTPRTIGDIKFNTCYMNPTRDLDGLVRITLGDNSGRRSLTVSMDAAFDYVVIYSGDPMPDSHRRRALAIEPMTCASDAFNHTGWGLISLSPGESTSGSWSVNATGI